MGKADLAWPSTFTTGAGKTARRHGVLDATVEGRFGPPGETLTAAFVRLEVLSKWPLVTGSDVRNNSGYLVHLVTRQEKAAGGRVSPRLRMGDSSYRLTPPRDILRPFVASADAALVERLPDRPAIWAEDIDGDGTDEIIASFRRQMAMSARPEGRLHIFRIEGRAVVDALSIPIVIPDVTEDFDFWGFLVAGIEATESLADPAGLGVSYIRTSAAEDQRTDGPSPNDFPPRVFRLPAR